MVDWTCLKTDDHTNRPRLTMLSGWFNSLLGTSKVSSCKQRNCLSTTWVVIESLLLRALGAFQMMDTLSNDLPFAKRSKLYDFPRILPIHNMISSDRRYRYSHERVALLAADDFVARERKACYPGLLRLCPGNSDARVRV